MTHVTVRFRQHGFHVGEDGVTRMLVPIDDHADAMSEIYCLAAENKHLTAENRRLRGLVRGAFVEGWQAGFSAGASEDLLSENPDLDAWDDARTRLALAETERAPVRDIAERIVVDDGQQSLDRRDQCAEAGAEIKRLTAENERLSNALRRIKHINCGPDQASSAWKCEEVAEIARLALAETAPAQRDGDYGTPEGTR